MLGKGINLLARACRNLFKYSESLLQITGKITSERGILFGLDSHDTSLSSACYVEWNHGMSAACVVYEEGDSKE